jgi:hypothetical protein
MNQQQKRQIAIRATRSQARRIGVDPAAIDGRGALVVLDDLARVEPDLVASEWYAAASDNQVKLFVREWGIKV